MNVNTRRPDPDPAPPVADGQMLDEVYRRLVRIHSAVVERTNSDTTIVPWTERELWDLLQDLGAFRRERRKTTSATS